MLKYILKRIGAALLTLFVITFLLFVFVRIMPGNPFPSERMTPDQIEYQREILGLNKNIFEQYFTYMGKVLFKGDFGNGTSLYYGTPISTVLGLAIKNSFAIGGLSVLIGTVLGFVLGYIAALNKGKFLDGLCTVLSIIGVCIPSYVFLIFLRQSFATNLKVFPFFFDTNNYFVSMILPAMSMSLLTFSTIAKFTRNEMVEVMDSDFMLLVESKGITGVRLYRHSVRNALIPVVTVLAPLVVDLLTGALVVEKIYGINGIGKLMVDSIVGEGIDYNYVLALGMLYSALYIGIMLIVDILYGLLDPRIRVTAKEGN